MPYLTREKGVRLYYEDTGGGGVPVLLTHGFGASTGMWQRQVAAFRDRCRLVTWDMRGHGLTDAPEDLKYFSQALTVDDMRALLDHLDIGRAVIAGHSLGGFMSLAFNVEHPGRVKALYLQGCGPGYRKDEARVKWNERAENRARTLEEGGLEALGGASEVPVSIQRSAKGLALAARGILSQVDARVIDSLPNINVPVLVLVGADDTNYLTGSAYMAKKIPGARSLVVRKAGHGVNVDQPEIVNAALAKFLAAL